ncbi:MAG: hypothetical protein J0M04_08770 [Verrucomicrobia bacterium]|nr:hypothetical protein [Verrucomicrobiota bacterium]
MNIKSTLIIPGLMLAGAAVTNATVIGFGNLGGSNTTVPAALGSRASAAGNGFVVTNGTTPNIVTSWDANWDIHTSGHFTNLENLTVGGGDWDNQGSIPRVGQLDFGTHSITFSADAGYALVLGSFDFAHTAETLGTTQWTLSLTAISTSSVVWTQSLTLNNNPAANAVVKVTPNFTGALGEDYTLTFTRTSETYSSNGRHAIDNLSFTQVPEASMAGLAGLGVASLLVRRRRR